MDPLLFTIVAVAVIVGISFALGRGLLADSKAAFTFCEPFDEQVLALLGPLNAACRGEAIIWPVSNLSEIVAATTGEKPSASWQQKLEAASADFSLIHTGTGKPIVVIRMIEPLELEDDEDPEPIAAAIVQISEDKVAERALQPLGAHLVEICWAEEYDEVALYRALRPLFKAAKQTWKKSA